MRRMTHFRFDLRFRATNEEEGRGSLAFHYDTSGTSFSDVLCRAIDDVLVQHPDAALDRVTYYSSQIF